MEVSAAMEMKMVILTQVVVSHRFMRKGDATRVLEALRQVVEDIIALVEVGQVDLIKQEEAMVEMVVKERYKLNTPTERMDISKKCLKKLTVA